MYSSVSSPQPETPETGGGGGPARRPAQVLIVLMAVVMILAAFYVDRALAPRFLPEPSANLEAPSFPASWLVPLESNAFRRPPTSGQPLVALSNASNGFAAKDGRHAWLVGGNGTVLASTDGGVSWEVQTSGSKKALSASYFAADNLHGWAVGEDGLILATTDGGKQWVAQQTPSRSTLNAVHFLEDHQHGWAVGGEGSILMTTDGGQTWLPRPAGSRAILNGVSFTADGRNGLAVGAGGAILGSEDGGRTWAQRSSPTQVSLYGVAFASKAAWAAAVGREGTVLISRDGGLNWVAMPSGTRDTLWSLHIATDGERAWAVGREGTIVSTQDGGKTLVLQNSGIQESLWVVNASRDGLLAWALGGDGYVASTRDGGKNWTAKPPGSRPALNGLSFAPDGLHGVAVGRAGTVLVSDDGGRHWAAVRSGFSGWLNAVRVAADGSAAWWVGGKASLARGSLNGLAWQALKLPVQVSLSAVSLAKDGTRAWVAGVDGTLLHTADGGQTWVRQNSGTTRTLWSVAMDKAGRNGFAVGDEGLILGTRDGGEHWVTQSSGTSRSLNSVSLAEDGLHAWAVGDEGTILATADGGRTWSAQLSPSRTWLNALRFAADGRHGWAVGGGGVILATADGGSHWERQSSGTQASLNGLEVAPDGRHLWVVGDDGSLLLSANGGDTWESVKYARYPAPWFWLLLVLTVAVAAQQLLRLWQAQHEKYRNPSITDKAVSDEAISGAAQDRLAFAPIASALERFLRNAATKAPLVLAITAPWGRGKSSLMGLLQHEREKGGAPCVWFNAWHHQKDEVLLAPLLSALRDRGLPSLFSAVGLGFRLRLMAIRLRRRPVFGAFCVAGVALMLWSIHTLWWGETRSCAVAPDVVDLVRHATAMKLGDALSDLLSILSGCAAARAALPEMLLGALASYVFLAQFYRAFPDKPSSLLPAMAKRLPWGDGGEARTVFRERFRVHFRDVTAALAPRTLTVFIDDLDRCEAAKSFEMLEAVNYLASNGQVFVVLGVARQVLETQVAQCTGELASLTDTLFRQASPAGGTGGEDGGAGDTVALRYAREYLRKLIQIEIPVPALDQARLAHLVQEAEAAPRRARLRAYAALESVLTLAHRQLAWLLPGLAVCAVVYWLSLQWQAVAPEAFQERIQPEPAELAEAFQREAAWTTLLSKAAEAGKEVGKEADPRKAKGGQSGAGGVCPQAGAEIKGLQDNLAQTLRDYRASRAESLRLFEEDASGNRRKLDAERKKRDWLAGQIAQAENCLIRLTQGDSPKAPPKEASPDTQPSGGAESTRQRARSTGEALVGEGPGGDLPVFLVCGVLLLGAATVAWRKRHYLVEDSADFRRALDIWLPLLASHPTRNTPREIKRFLNLARYAAVRLRDGQAALPSWWDRLMQHWGFKLTSQLEPRLTVAEHKIVAMAATRLVVSHDTTAEEFVRLMSQVASAELAPCFGRKTPTAADLSLRAAFRECQSRAIASASGASISADEARAFAAVVGELQEMGLAAARQP